MSTRTSRAKVWNPGPGADWRTASRSDGKSVLQRRRNRVPQRLENVSRSDSGTEPSAEAGPRHAVRGRHYPSSSTCSGSITSTRHGRSTCQRFRPVACRDTASVPLARRAHRPSRVHRRFMTPFAGSTPGPVPAPVLLARAFNGRTGHPGRGYPAVSGGVPSSFSQTLRNYAAAGVLQCFASVAPSAISHSIAPWPATCVCSPGGVRTPYALGGDPPWSVRPKRGRTEVGFLAIRGQPHRPLSGTARGSLGT